MNYKKVYSAANTTEAHLIQGLLERESIETNLSGESLSTVWGGMQTDFSEVEILVDEEKYTEAVEIIANNSVVREKYVRINIEHKPRIILLAGPAKAIFPSVELEGYPDITTAPGAIIFNGINGNILKDVRSTPIELTRNSALYPFLIARNL